jgi:hypothetical protein
MPQATTAPNAPPAPTAPDLPAAIVPAAPVAPAPLAGVPVTAADVRALRAKRSELSNQLESAAGRRARLSNQLAGKEGADRAGIEARIGVLDKRIMQLESDIAETGRQLTMAPSALVTSDAFSRGVNPNVVVPLGGAFMMFVMAPIAFAAARMLWKRTNRMTSARTASFPDEAARRLERLEQGVDAIAIEVERISEGQRFVTKLLSEAHNSPALIAPQREPSAIDR